MQEPVQIVLNFSKSMSLALQQSQARKDFYTEDEAAFLAAFPGIAPAFKTDWQTAITNADNVPTDDAVDNESVLLTTAVTQNETLGRNLLGNLYFRCKIVFPTREDIRNYFGADQYAAADNTFSLLELLQLAHANTNNPVDADYKTSLIANGFTQPSIDMLGTLRTNLYNANRTQESFIGNIQVKTQVRRIAFNTMWAFDQMVNIMAQVVYQNDYAKQQRYLLDPENASGSEQTITLNAGVTKQIADNAQPAHQYEMRVISPAGGTAQVCTSATDDIVSCETNGAALENDVRELLISDIGGNQFVKISNAGAEQIKVGVKRIS